MALATLYLCLILLLVYWVESGSMERINILILKRNPAIELESWLKSFHWQKGALQNGLGELPQYKFYTEVVEVLLGLARHYGGHYQDALLFLREGLQADRQFEKKLWEMTIGTWLQMGLMVLLTWGFILAAIYVVEIKVVWWKFFLIGLWQATGLWFLPYLIRFYREKFFGDIGRLWKIFYILRSLHQSPLPRSEVFMKAGLKDLDLIKQKNLESIVEKLKENCQMALKRGGSYEQELLSLMAELRFQEKWHFELFEKRLTVVKLGLMAVFFLPSYVGFIFFLLSDLLTLM